MLAAYGEALATLFQPVVLLAILGGVVVGLTIGIMPGIGSMVGIALLLPFLWKMPPAIALGFLVALSSVATTGGSITAILLNIPGTNPNAATLLDGFPMNQKGEGARAIGAAVMSSMAGGLVPAFLALAMIPAVVPIVLAFRSPELFMLVLVGISFLATLTGHSAIKGLISGLLGLLLALVGFDSSTGDYRFTFGSMFLYGGLGIVVVALGLFGLAELLDMLAKGKSTIAQVGAGQRQDRPMAGVLQGIKDVGRHAWLWFRSTIIGFIIGLLPGAGGDVATFVAYGQAKQTSRDPESFGTGRVEGVIAPESANNAKEAGALLTTMAFGIPGSAIMALFLAAFVLVGVVPGPSMLVDHLPLALTLLLGIALANVIGGIICFGAAPYLIKVAFVHLDFLFPTVIVIVTVGAFLAVGSIMNIVVVIVFGLFGLLMKRFGYSRPALLLGFVLGELFEFYLIRSYKLFGPLFFVTPIGLSLLAVVVLLFSYPFLKKVVPRFIKHQVKGT